MRLPAYLVPLVGRAGPAVIYTLARSWQIEVRAGEHLAGLRASGTPYVLLAWHECLLPVLWHHRGLDITAVVSEARDGEYLSRLASRLGYGLIRGSSSRGGRRALRAAIRVLAAGKPVGITPDGPRGPRRELKPGALMAARAGQAVVLPVHAAATWSWRARSWDRFLVPRPFARVRLAYGAPLRVADGGARRMVAAAVAALAEAERLAEWPNGAATHTV